MHLSLLYLSLCLAYAVQASHRQEALIRHHHVIQRHPSANRQNESEVTHKSNAPSNKQKEPDASSENSKNTLRHHAKRSKKQKQPSSVATSGAGKIVLPDKSVWPPQTRTCTKYTSANGKQNCDALITASLTMIAPDFVLLNPNIQCNTLPIPKGTRVCTEISAASLSAPLSFAKRASKAPAKVVTYKAPVGEQPSADYSITVNGQPVFCYGSFQFFPSSANTILGRPVDPITFCSFDFSGTVTVNVQLLSGLTQAGIKTKTVTARPLSAGIKPKVMGSSFSFTMSSPGQLTFEPNGGLARPLHVFGNPLEVNVPSSSDPSVMYFGPGYHDLTPTTVTSNISTVYIAGGAVVRLLPVPLDQAIWNTTLYDETIYQLNPLFSANWLDTITIRGRGILDGRNALQTANQRNNLLWMQGTTNGLIDGITLREGGNWNIVLFDNGAVRVNNVKILGHYVNTDAVVASSPNTLVENTFVHNADDGIQIKSWGANVTNCVFRNNIVWSTVAGAFGIPSETFADISGITWQDSTVLHSVEPNPDTNRGSIGINAQGTGTIKNINFKNMVVEHTIYNNVLRVQNNADVDPTQPLRGPIRTVNFTNVQVLQCTTCGTFLEGQSAASNVNVVGLKTVKMGPKANKLVTKMVQTNSFVSGISISN